MSPKHKKTNLIKYATFSTVTKTHFYNYHIIKILRIDQIKKVVLYD